MVWHKTQSWTYSHLGYMVEVLAITPDGYERLTTFPRQLFVS